MLEVLGEALWRDLSRFSTTEEARDAITNPIIDHLTLVLPETVLACADQPVDALMRILDELPALDHLVQPVEGPQAPALVAMTVSKWLQHRRSALLECREDAQEQLNRPELVPLYESQEREGELHKSRALVSVAEGNLAQAQERRIHGRFRALLGGEARAQWRAVAA